LSFLRHRKIYQSDGLKRELNYSFSPLTDHRSDESSTSYSFMSCSPAELTSASPVLQSFSLNLAAVKPSAANHNCPSFSLSQLRGPLHPVPQIPANTLDYAPTGKRKLFSELPSVNAFPVWKTIPGLNGVNMQPCTSLMSC
jgi:hypothetical protein